MTWLVAGIGFVLLMWAGSTRYAPVVILFLIAALIFQAQSGGPFGHFLQRVTPPTPKGQSK